MSEKSKTIYNLELHEIMFLENKVRGISIIRVPGGWIYTFYAWDVEGKEIPNSLFVPFNSEFQKELQPIL